MSFEWLWTAEADAQMTRIEEDDSPSGAVLLANVRRILGRLEVDPADGRLGTRMFTTLGYGHVRVTPIGIGEWCLLWTLRSETVLLAVHLDELSL